MVKIKMHLEGLLECATIASAKGLKSHDLLLVMNNLNTSWGDTIISSTACLNPNFSKCQVVICQLN